MSENAVTSKWVPVVDQDLCNGCQECIVICKPRCLEIVGFAAALAKPDRCLSDEHCVAPCPIEAIHMAWTPMTGDRSVGKWQ